MRKEEKERKRKTNKQTKERVFGPRLFNHRLRSRKIDKKVIKLMKIKISTGTFLTREKRRDIFELERIPICYLNPWELSMIISSFLQTVIESAKKSGPFPNNRIGFFFF